MKQILIYLTILLIFICSCEENNVNTQEKTDTFVIIGDPEVDIIALDTIIYSENNVDSIHYSIDLDSDGLVDFKLCINYNFSSCFFFSNFQFNCMNNIAKVCINDTIQCPDILSSGDSLSFTRQWLSDNFSILDLSGICEQGGGDGKIYKYGNLIDVTNKYIGLLTEKNEYPVYGWIKFSVPDNELIKSFTIHEIGRKKAAYKK